MHLKRCRKEITIGIIIQLKNIDYFIFLMGNEKSNLQQYHITRFFRRQDWIPAQIKSCYQIWKHKYTHQMVEVYRLSHIPPRKDMDIYEFRSQHQDLVKVCFLVADSDPFLCGSGKQVELIVEHIPLRLTDIDEFVQSQGLTALVSAMRGFRLIQHKFGKVEPRQNLIGFNHEGKCKVWLSQHSYHNQRDNQDAQCYFDSPSDQLRRIRKIYSLIERKTRGMLLPPELKQNIFYKNVDYEKVISIVSNYAKKRRISLKKYYQKKKNQFEYQYTPVFMSSFEIESDKEKVFEHQKGHLKKVSSLENLHHEKKQNVNVFTEPHETNKIYRGSLLSNVVRSSSTTIRPQTSITFVKPQPIDSSIKSKESNFSPQVNFVRVEDNRKRSTIIDAIHVDLPLENMAPKKKIQEVHNKQASCENKQIEKKNVEKRQIKEQAKTMQKEEHTENKDEKKSNIFHEQKAENIDQLDPIKQHENYQEISSVKEIVSAQVVQSQKQIPNNEKKSEKEAQIKTNKANVDDFLDVNYMEKSLQKKFSMSATPKVHQEDDLLNIDRLEEGLIKFQKSQKRLSKEGSWLNLQSQFTIKSGKKEDIPSETNQKKMLTPYHLSAASSLGEQNITEWYKGSAQINKYSSATTDLFVSEGKYSKPRASTTYNTSYLDQYKTKKHYNSLYQEKSLNIPDKYSREKDLDLKYLHHVKNRQSNKFTSSFNLDKNVEMTFCEKKQTPGVTYEDLRSMLQTDL